MELKNIKSFNDFLNEKNDNNTDVSVDESLFEDLAQLSIKELFELDESLLEASKIPISEKEKKKGQKVRELLGKMKRGSEVYRKALEKFKSVFWKEAAKTAQKEKMNKSILKKIDKVTINDL